METKYRDAELILLLSDARGQYIPRDFAIEVKRDCITGVSADDLDYLADGPDGEHYWDTWQHVCDHARVTDPTTGVEYFVYQDGDCWLIEVGAEWNEDPAISDQNWIVEVQS